MPSPRRDPFTHYVEICLEREASGDEVQEVLNLLRKALWERLRRQRLTGASPTYLGVVGHPRWTEPAIDELNVEAFSYVFLHRMKALQRSLLTKTDLSGLVRRNLANFVFERQKKHDPIGYQVFDTLRGAVREALSTGDLTTPSPGSRITGRTVLIPQRRRELPAGFSMASEVASWNDELLKALVIGRGRRKDEALAELHRRLATLPVVQFALREVLEPLKSDTRMRWSRWLEDASDVLSSSSEPFDWTLPDSVDPYSFERLVDCVAGLIAKDDGDDRQKTDLLDLWRVYRTWAAGEPPKGWRGSPEKSPGQRQLATILGVHRDRLKRLIRILQILVDSCKE